MGAKISKAAVIGAGVMGSGIAAHLANAGLSVVLLDVPEEAPRRNRRAEDAVQRQLATGGFMHPSCAARIMPGNIEDDLGLLADADWIVEAVAERLDIKRQLFSQLEAVRKDGSVISSNTSTLPLAAMIEGQPPRFGRDFLVTHFFNPPRQMRLLELVAGPLTSPEAVETIDHLADVVLGKGVVACKDRPGFIANRIGCFWIAAALSEAVALGLTVEEADAVIGRPFGIPPTGVFGLVDLIGLDLMPQVWGSLARNLPAFDPLRRYDPDPPIIRSMIDRGLTGRKAGAGFYRVLKEGGEKTRQAFDLESGEYRPLRPASLDSLAASGNDLRALLSHEDRGGRYARAVMGTTLAYAASLVPEVADELSAVDHAMRLGYAWTQGPFELIDRLGPSWFAEQLGRDGQPVPPLLREATRDGAFYRVAEGKREALDAFGTYRPLRRPPGTLLLADVKLAGAPVLTSPSGSLWDLGDGVACLEFHTKANAFNADLLALLEKATPEVGKGFRALILGNDAANFSAGADLRALLDAARRGDWAWIEDLVRSGQRAFRGLKFAPFPVVAAVAGSALGGGCEVALHCDAIQAHAELQIGLVEARVGLVPGWGGCKELLLRLSAAGSALPAQQAFDVVAGARTSSSALEARDLGFLRPADGITMNRDRLLADAKDTALRLVRGYRPPVPRRQMDLLGPVAGAVPATADAHDRRIAEALARIMSAGGERPSLTLSEDAVSALEQEAFMALIRQPEAQARIQSMIEPRR
jgi:3-hydroxyacyl-CoA dehydrogenase